MLNALRVDMRRYMTSKAYMLLALTASVVYPLFLLIVMKAFSAMMGADYSVEITEFTAYSSMASIFLAVLVTEFLHGEVGEGIVRNKIISGKRKSQVFLSYCIVNMFLAAFLQIVSVLVTRVAAFCLGLEVLVPVADLLRLTTVTAFAGVAISIFYTALYLCFCTSKIAIALPTVVSVAIRILMIFVLDALYPASGVPKASGFTLKLFVGLDRFVAFFHLNGFPHWDNISYLIGNVTLIAVSLGTGLLIFTNKDLK